MGKPSVTLYVGQIEAGKTYFLQHLVLDMISPLMRPTCDCDVGRIIVFSDYDWPDLSCTTTSNFTMCRSTGDLIQTGMPEKWVSYIDELRSVDEEKTVIFDGVLNMSEFSQIHDHADETFRFIVSIEVIDETLLDWMAENVDQYMIGTLTEKDEERLVSLFDDNLSLDAVIAYSKREENIRFFSLPSVSELRRTGRILNSTFYWKPKTAILWWDPGIQQYKWRKV